MGRNAQSIMSACIRIEFFSTVQHPASAQVLLTGTKRKKTEDACGINGIPENFFLDLKGAFRSYLLGYVKRNSGRPWLNASTT